MDHTSFARPGFPFKEHQSSSGLILGELRNNIFVPLYDGPIVVPRDKLVADSAKLPNMIASILSAENMNLWLVILFHLSEKLIGNIPKKRTRTVRGRRPKDAYFPIFREFLIGQESMSIGVEGTAIRLPSQSKPNPNHPLF